MSGLSDLSGLSGLSGVFDLSDLSDLSVYLNIMPNQNPPDPNQNQPQGGSSSIPLSPQADLPPLPPEFQSVVETKVDSSGSAAPPEPEVTNLVNAPKKKFGTKKIIATILGILLLIGGVGAGIALTSQKQLFQQKAFDSSQQSSLPCTTSDDCAEGLQCNWDNECIPTPTPGPTWPSPTWPPNPTDQPTNQPTSSPDPTHKPGNCGNKPSPLPNFTKPPFNISTSSLTATAQKLWVHYYMGGLERKINISLNGTAKVITVQEGGKYDTGLTVKKGDELKIIGIEEPNQKAACAPDQTKPNMSFAWMAPNSDNTCGTTLPDPGGNPYKPKDITNYLKYIANSKNTVLSYECWADWREWPGDYDFEDFFLTFSVSGTTNAPYCAAVKVYDTSWSPVSVASSDSVASVPTLRAGTKYRFTVLGSPVASIQKARIKFTLSDGTLTTKYSTQKKPNTNEYYIEYVVPAGTTSLDVKAQVSDGTTWY